MLSKLLKYELKATGRKFLPLYGILLVASILVNISLRFPDMDLLILISILALVGLFVALGVLTLITIIQRFKNNLLSDEGYLMFTLPVSTEKLILSKLITATVWTFASGVVSILSFRIIFANEEFISRFAEVYNELMPQFLEFVKGDYITLAILLAICVFFQFLYLVLLIYTSLSVAQMAVFNKHRSFISIVAFLFIYIFVSSITGVIFKNTYPAITIENIQGMFMVVGTALAVNIGLCGIMFFGTYYLLKNHLNID